MRMAWIVAFATVLSVIVAAGEKSQSTAAEYRVAHGWPDMPENTMLDEVSGVAVGPSGEVLVLTRGGRKWPDSGELDKKPIPKPTVFIFDATSGRLLAQWGENVMALPHQLSVDANGNVWIADVALHQVFKFSHEGKLLMTVGEQGVPGDDARHFNQPTDVAVAADGSFYVSDGYKNSRVVKFAADGTLLTQWGTSGNAPGQFKLPHGIALDSKGRVYVLDRENKRIQVFDAGGKFVAEWKGPPFVNPQDVIVGREGVFVAEGGDDKLPDRTGFWFLRHDGSLAGHCGRFGNYDGQVVDPHAIAVAADGAVYIADFEGKRVQKFVPASRR